jgi:uncharacterized pyridoxal phosphate-containing UPF0001 family protein
VVQLKYFAAANVDMRYLSMGLSNSYRIAIQEGANIVRIGTKIFGSRNAKELADSGNSHPVRA